MSMVWTESVCARVTCSRAEAEHAPGRNGRKRSDKVVALACDAHVLLLVCIWSMACCLGGNEIVRKTKGEDCQARTRILARVSPP